MLDFTGFPPARERQAINKSKTAMQSKQMQRIASVDWR